MAFFGYELLPNITRYQDIGCLMIQNYYLPNNINLLINLIGADTKITNSSGTNMLITKFYLKSSQIGNTGLDYLAKLKLN